MTEGMCVNGRVCEGTASSQGPEDSGGTVEHLRVEWWQVQDESHRLGCTFS